MNERGDVNQFNDNGQVYVFRVDFAGGSASQQRDERPQTFSAATDGVCNIGLNGRVERRRLFCNAGVDLLQVRLH